MVQASFNVAFVAPPLGACRRLVNLIASRESRRPDACGSRGVPAWCYFRPGRLARSAQVEHCRGDRQLKPAGSAKRLNVRAGESCPMICRHQSTREMCGRSHIMVAIWLRWGSSVGVGVPGVDIQQRKLVADRYSFGARQPCCRGDRLCGSFAILRVLHTHLADLISRTEVAAACSASSCAEAP